MEYATTFGGAGKPSQGDTTSASTKQQRRSGKARKSRANKHLKARAGKDINNDLQDGGDDDAFRKIGHLSPSGNEDQHDSEHSSTEARDQVCHDRFQEFEEIKRKGIIDKNQAK